MIKRPLLSIITVCLNSEKTISRTIESVVNQSFQNYEYIIIDGKSTDNTLKIISDYKDILGNKLRIISEKDSGMYNAINKGISMTTGKYVGIINSDDFYDINTFEHINNIDKNTTDKEVIIIGDMERVSANGDLIYRYRYSYNLVKQKACFGHPSMFATKEVYDLIGLYDESFKWAADGEWQYRAHEYDRIKWILCPFVFNHMREGGASDNPKYKWIWFKERVKMKKRYNKKLIPLIYLDEIKSLIRTEIKSIIPSSFQKFLYKIRYW